MANTLKLRRSATAGSVPTTAQLALGELAMNTADGKLFMKTDDGAGTTEVVEIGSGGSITIASAPPEGADPGDIYWDQDDGSAYIYYDDGNGAAQWVPLTPLAESVIPGASADKFDDISGSFNGVLTDFTININGSAHSPLYQNATLISIGGVIQEAGTAYTISGSTISFTTAPAAGLDFFGIDLASPVLIGTPNDGTVTSAKLDTDLTIDLASGSATSPSITFDSNTGIYSPGADQVAISTNGTGRLFVNASGVMRHGSNAGGTYNGNITFAYNDRYPAIEYRTGNTIDGRLWKDVNGGNLLIENVTGGIAFETSNQERLRITSDGKLGLGTSSPGNLLTIAGGTGAVSSGGVLGIRQKGNTRDDGITLTSSFSNSVRQFVDGNGTFNIESSFTTGNNLSITKEGRVGIGTTSPDRLVHIFKGEAGTALSDSNTALMIENSNHAIIQMASPNTASNRILFGDPQDADAGRLTYDHSNNAFLIHVNASERMRIDSSGRLGLGTSAPDSKFEVRDNLATGIISRSTNTQATNTNKALKVRNNSDTDTFNVSYKGQGYFADSLGIGTTNPGGNLHIETPATTAGWQLRLDSVGLNNESGFYRTALDNYQLVLRNAAGGLSYITNTGGASTSTLEFNVQGSERARIDSSGRLLVGATSSVATGSSTAGLQLHNTSTGNGAFLSIARFNNDATGGKLAICKSRNTTVAAGTIVQDGDTAGAIEFAVDNGTNLSSRVSQIFAQVDGTPSSSSTPGRLIFYSTPSGSTTPVEQMRIRGNGFVSAPGVYSNTTAVAANVNVDSNGLIRRSTSSAKYKTDIETLQDSYADALLGCRPVWYRSTCENDNPSWGWWGFIAEEVAEIDPRLVQWKTVEVAYDENGSVVEAPCEPEPEGVAYDRFVPHLLNLIKRQGEAIAELQAEVTALKGS